MIKAWPIFVVHTPDRKGCGHQHQEKEQAENCAVSLARRHPGEMFTVVHLTRGHMKADGNYEVNEVSLDSFEVKKVGSNE